MGLLGMCLLPLAVGTIGGLGAWVFRLLKDAANRERVHQRTRVFHPLGGFDRITLGLVVQDPFLTS